MHHQNSIFCQLLKVIPRHHFERLVQANKADFRVRNLRCWDQFVALLYAQFTGCNSLRELESGFNAHQERHYHLGCHAIKRSTLAEANSKRSVALYESLFSWLLNKAIPSNYSASEALNLIDSSTISLNQKLFHWADFRTKKNGVKLHLVFDPAADVPTYFSVTPAKKHDMKAAKKFPITKGAAYAFDRAYNCLKWWQELHDSGCTFVSRMKKNTKFKVQEQREISDESVREDEVIALENQKFTASLRRIVFYCKTREKELVFVTNDLQKSATEIADMYKERWKIELFFKWIKQNLKIKKFLGNSENAVKIQIIVALISYLILRILQQELPISTTLKSLKDRIKATLFQRKTIDELFRPPDKANNINGLIQLKLGGI